MLFYVCMYVCASRTHIYTHTLIVLRINKAIIDNKIVIVVMPLVMEN